MSDDKNVFSTLSQYNVGIGLLLSAIAYFFGYLKKALYLKLLNITVSPFDIYDSLNFYTTGLLFVISALLLPAVFILYGFILKKLMNKYPKTRDNIRYAFVGSGALLIMYIPFSTYVVRATETIPYLSLVLYLLPIPLLLNSYELFAILGFSWMLIICLIIMGYCIHDNACKVTLLKSNLFRLVVVFVWVVLLFYTQFTEPTFSGIGVDYPNKRSNKEIYFSWLTTNMPIDNSVKGDDSLYHTRCAILNFRNGVYYVITVALSGDAIEKEPYSFNMVPKEYVIGLAQQHYMATTNRKRISEKGRLYSLISQLEPEKYRIIHDVKFNYFDREIHFEDIVVSRKAIFTILPVHQAGNLFINNAGNVLMANGFSKTGVVFGEQWGLEQRKKVLADLVGEEYPIVDLFVLTNETATIEGEKNFPYKIIKIDMLNYYIEHYDGPLIVDVELVINRLNKRDGRFISDD